MAISSCSGPTAHTRRETTLAHHASTATLHAFPRRVDSLLPELMVPFNTAHRKRCKVDLSKFVAATHRLGPIAGPVLGVPLFSYLLISRDVVHDLVVHAGRETAKHQAEGQTVDSDS